MSQINAYLNLNGQCREAMTFYHSCLGGVLTMQTVENSPMANQMPPEQQHHILHASLVKDQLVLLGSDRVSPDGAGSNSITLALQCNTEEEINTYFSKLVAGGRVVHPLHKFYNGTLGTLTDKYGLSWMLKL